MRFEGEVGEQWTMFLLDPAGNALEFKAFADDLAKRLAADPKTDFEADRVAMVAKIRENIQVPRHARMEVSGNGMIAAYIHTGGKVGVLVEVGAGKESTVAADDFIHKCDAG